LDYFNCGRLLRGWFYVLSPGDAEGLEKELAKSLSHMIVVRLDVEHMTGKEAIELVRMRQTR